MKKTITFILALLLMSSCFYALCVDYDKSFDFSLSAVDLNVNEQGELYVGNGDIITVTLSLNRIDSDASFEMYAMQDEIEYDREFFELVEIGTPAVSGITCTDIARRDRHRAFYMNYLSMVG
ncbi:MAG: hypothetical protein GX633_01925, partial [Clostridiales bacterium]|nr:hypothetical protein [Clostridiales bacterium]